MRRAPELRAACEEDVVAMLPRLRVKDAIDVMTASRGSVEDAMRQSLERAAHAWTWVVEGRPACMFGVTLRPVVTGGALVWIFTTTDVERNARMFWRGSRTVLRVLLDRYGAVEGYCDGRFLQSAQWLRRLGFDLGEPIDTAGVPFYHFEMVKP